MTSARLRLFVAALAVFALNLSLNHYFFQQGESPYRESIEGGYASMGRFLAYHPNPFAWNPLQYSGLPTHFWYPPILPYLTAFCLRTLPSIGPLETYRWVATVFVCLVPVSMLGFVWWFTRSAAWASVAAVLYTFVSPVYLIFPAIDRDRGITYLPWRVQVFTKYGEGPHNAGLVILPLAIAACWNAAVSRSRRSIAIAAALLAITCLTNWIAALALAIAVLSLLLAGAGSAPYTGFLARRVIMAAAFAYLLAAFWLTPSYISNTFFNWPFDSFQFKVEVTQYLLMAGWILTPLAIRMIYRRYPKQSYLCFLTLAFASFFYLAAAHYWVGADTIPESRRYTLEAEFFFFALAIEVARQLITRYGRFARDVGVALLAVMFAWGSLQAYTYITGAWKVQPAPNQTTPEYNVASFLNSRQTKGRVFVSGGTRFRMNSWFSVPQLGGTFESGLRNRYSLMPILHTLTARGSQPENRVRDVVWLMRAWGVEYFALHGRNSREHWRDVPNADLFRAQLTPVYENGPEAVYQLPFRSLGQLVRPDELPSGLPTGYNVVQLERYVRALDDTSRSAPELEWRGNSRLEVKTPVPAGFWLKVAVSYDPGWRAEQDGKPIAVLQDNMGHILLKPSESSGSRFTLSFSPDLDQMALTPVSAVAWGLCLVVLLRRA